MCLAQGPQRKDAGKNQGTTGKADDAPIFQLLVASWIGDRKLWN